MNSVYCDHMMIFFHPRILKQVPTMCQTLCWAQMPKGEHGVSRFTEETKRKRERHHSYLTTNLWVRWGTGCPERGNQGGREDTLEMVGLRWLGGLSVSSLLTFFTSTAYWSSYEQDTRSSIRHIIHIILTTVCDAYHDPLLQKREWGGAG